MTKNYQYVSKCSCCNAKIIRVSVPYMHTSNLAALAIRARETLGKYHFTGSLSLQCAGEAITNFYYEYKDRIDLARNNLLVALLSNLAKEYFNEITDDGINWVYHSIELQ